MPDVVSNDELNALAAEYVLGTLDYEERKGAAALLDIDPMFRGIVRIWERRFGELHLMVEAVEPDPQLWLRIKPKMAGVEQVAPAIPSHAEDPIAAAAATTPVEVLASAPALSAEAAATTPAPAGAMVESKANAVVGEGPEPAATETPAVESKSPESKSPESTSPESQSLESQPPETKPPESQPLEAKPLEAKPPEAKPPELKPAEPKLPEPKPPEPKPPAIAEAELKLAELAALLPVTAEPGGATPAAPVEPLPENGLHTHAPDLVPRGFVPPAPMSTRGTPAVVEVPIRTGGRGWIAATLAMALIAVALAGLISAWRFFPERLPAQLRANAVLNLTTTAQPAAPKAAARPKPAPFDE